ncbi:MAG: pyruvate synthase [Clostridiaceae bacterium BRH_c20a]|nr:MAG: pyruvate synthase [Clostridiaceae bacterium BRH_c20a]
MLTIGAVCEAGKSRLNKTGSWRDYYPEITAKCTGCGICELFCPDSSITIIDKKCIINYDYCKGCGICANECPKTAILMKEERK